MKLNVDVQRPQAAVIRAQGRTLRLIGAVAVFAGWSFAYAQVPPVYETYTDTTQLIGSRSSPANFSFAFIGGTPVVQTFGSVADATATLGSMVWFTGSAVPFLPPGFFVPVSPVTLYSTLGNTGTPGSNGFRILGIGSAPGSGGAGGFGGPIQLLNYRHLTGVSGAGVVFAPAGNAPVIFARSLGGQGGSGGHDTSTGVGQGATGGNGGAGGIVLAENHGWLFTAGPSSPGIYAESRGGAGGVGGGGSGPSGGGGQGGSAAAGGPVTVTNFGNIIIGGNINGLKVASPDSPGIHARSVAGSSGSGGNADFGFFRADGGSAASGTASGGAIVVNNSGTIQTGDVRSSAIRAESLGSGGGSGGNAGGVFSVGGGSGGLGGSGGTVNVTNSGRITAWQSRGIQALSMGGGGGDGGTAAGLLSIGGSGGNASAGTAVTVQNAADILSLSNAIFAQSVGGGGGSGGSTVGLVSIGGSGSGGGTGGSVSVTNSGNLISGGGSNPGPEVLQGLQGPPLAASAIVAQSIGGGGGHGGASVAGGLVGAVAIGGSGGGGGPGGDVTVTNNPQGSVQINTGGDASHGVLAQSVGGGGGAGGIAVAGAVALGPATPAVAVAIGGSGAGGGPGGPVNFTATGGALNINTQGAHAHGVLAQSVGGGGGAGGFSTAVSVGTLAAASVGLGGSGGGGGDGSTVMFTNTTPGTISTNAVGAIGELAQSVGGGGGHGGFAVSAAGAVASVSTALGGSGGAGGQGGAVTLNSNSTIRTASDHARGVVAQSVGGGGGTGGFSAAAGVGIASAAVSLGGQGGNGGSGSTVSLTTNSVLPTPGGTQSGFIATTGAHASGILAQSVGGGGGAGGMAISATGTGGPVAASLGFAMGGRGGAGGIGGNVTLTSNNVLVTTQGAHSDGIVAQSVGGGGGIGGLSVAGSVALAETSVAMGDSVGGIGGLGGTGGSVNLSTNNKVVTTANHSAAILAQSVGGGGGSGGMSVAGAVALNGAVGVSIGGNGGAGNKGGSVNLVAGGVPSGPGIFSVGPTFSGGSILTQGNGSPAVVAQSVGGGGGRSGLTVAFSLTGPQSLPVPDSISLAIGGNGGTGGDAGGVSATLTSVPNDGNNRPTTFITNGDHSPGVIAQSVGGGGGAGNLSISAAAGGFAFALPGLPTVKLGNLGNSAGNFGGAGGNGSAVILADDVRVVTAGDHSPAILAQSVGGGGGVGGTKIAGALSFDPDTGAGLSLGASGVNGALGGNADSVQVSLPAAPVNNQSDVLTRGLLSPGIIAQSVGGGGGNGGWSAALGAKVLSAPEAGPALAIAMGGTGGGGGTSGNVTVTNVNNVTTMLDGSMGVLAQSVGGGGGNGGIAVGVSVTNSSGKIGGLGSLTAALGGSGGAGGSSGNVIVSTVKESAIITRGDSAQGIFAQSVGGGGGNGGGSIAISASVGASSGSSLSASLGGNGGVGAKAGTVTVNSNSSIQTGNSPDVSQQAAFQNVPVRAGNDSAALVAQSVGGGGGHAGFSVSTDITVGSNSQTAGISVAIGGTGGSGNIGGAVMVTSYGLVLQTSGDRAAGILAQSVGGGGGKGGFSVSANISTGQQVGVSLGGNGGGGANADTVQVSNTSNISTGCNPGCPISGTGADHSPGIQAQSIGGGGGSGGFSVSGNVQINDSPSASVGVSLGGSGAGAGAGGAVGVSNASSILTSGPNSAGVLAQSVGGGGGSGGFSVSGSLQYSAGTKANAIVTTAVGGTGGSGGNAGSVTVATTAAVAAGATNTIQTLNRDSAGILAQSVSGGGGSGGFAVAASVPVNFAGLPIPVTVGGNNGVAAASGAVTVNDGSSLVGGAIQSNGGVGGTSITTSGARSSAIVAQSVTGGGGIGATSLGGDLANGGTPSFRLGSGSSAYAASAGTVTVTSSSTIKTIGTDSNAILAQSVGGGGGVLQFNVQGNAAWGQGTMNVGGVNQNANAASASAGTVTVAASGPAIATTGNRSTAILAQSIGGGGGLGTVSASGITSGGLAMFVGGGGTTANVGSGAATNVTNSAAISVSGLNSHGIVAQSIGGGGGIGLFAAAQRPTSVTVGNVANTVGDGGAVSVTNKGSITTGAAGSYGVIAQSIGGGGGLADYVTASGIGSITSLSAGSQGAGIGSGAGGSVSVTSTGAITTGGAGAVGIFAQSVGGGGGLDIMAGTARGGWGSGSAGQVSVTNNAAISTGGSSAHGIVAQSVGGNQSGGAVTVNAAANIITTGAGSSGIFAQSAGRGVVSVNVNSGAVVSGGTGPNAAGIVVAGGMTQPLITNSGTITSSAGVDGTAIRVANIGLPPQQSGMQNLAGGTINGSVAYPGWLNNHGTLNTGALVDVSGGRPGIVRDANQLPLNLVQSSPGGVISPFGDGRIGTTTIAGSLLQTAFSTLKVDVDPVKGADQLVVTNGATFDPRAVIQPNMINAHGLTSSGKGANVIVRSGAQASSATLNLNLSPVTVKSTAAVTYSATTDAASNNLTLSYSADFNPAGLTGNQQQVGTVLNRLLASSRLANAGTPISVFANAPDLTTLGKAYDRTQPLVQKAGTAVASIVSNQFSSLIHTRVQSTTAVGGTPPGSGAQLDLPSQPILLASNATATASDAGASYYAANDSERRERVGLWMEPFGGKARVEDDPFNVWKYTTSGFSGGVDYRFSNNFVGGVAVGWATTKVDFDGNWASGSHKSRFASVYGGYVAGPTHVEGVLSYGTHRFNNSREADAGRASSAHDGRTLSASVEAGRVFDLHDIRVQPFAAVSYNRISEDGTQETGAGPLGLTIGGRTTHSLASALGVRASKSFETSSGRVVPILTASWKHEFKGTTTVSSTFAVAPDLPFTAAHRLPGRDRLQLGAALQIVSRGGLSATIAYSAEKGSGFFSQALIGILRLAF